MTDLFLLEQLQTVKERQRLLEMRQVEWLRQAETCSNVMSRRLETLLSVLKPELIQLNVQYHHILHERLGRDNECFRLIVTCASAERADPNCSKLFFTYDRKSLKLVVSSGARTWLRRPLGNLVHDDELRKILLAHPASCGGRRLRTRKRAVTTRRI